MNYLQICESINELSFEQRLRLEIWFAKELEHDENYKESDAIPVLAHQLRLCLHKQLRGAKNK